MSAIEQALGEMPYARAIVEKQMVGGRRALRVWPVDGVEILYDRGRVPCWNGLRDGQKKQLIEGTVPFIRGDGHEGDCREAAAVLIETVEDEAPGPRFYCWGCGARHLQLLAEQHGKEER